MAAPTSGEQYAVAVLARNICNQFAKHKVVYVPPISVIQPLPMASAVARAYNRGLEAAPPAESRPPGAVKGSGGKVSLKLTLLASGRLM